jgi:D-alanyl-D-alanine carboxypeptidase/D-alanyl-D-alanine-endopeptidase (penicillin-binding protein 4)
MKLRTLLALCLLVARPGLADDFQNWTHRMEARSVRVSAGLWDLPTGKLLEAQGTDLALVPASTAKVLSTYAILRNLKPNFELYTEVWGDLRGGTVAGDLVFKGGGDPFLTSERIWLMAHELKAKGVLQVTGRIRLDQTAFDSQRFGNGWENTSANTTPPILPLSVNFNRENGKLAADPERMDVEVIQSILREAGIAVLEQPQTQQPSAPPQKLLAFASPPLRDLVMDINKVSNNFMDEMLVKAFGGGTWPGGIKRIQDFYESQLDLKPDKINLTDGSGLSKDDHISARTLAIVLRAAWNDFEVGPEFVSSLKTIGGEPWKLHITDPNLARRVRCKTGHLNGVTSVCGYLQTPTGKLRVFAIILNGNCGDNDVWELVSRWANQE